MCQYINNIFGYLLCFCALALHLISYNMEVIYIEGSSAHQYLQEQSLIGNNQCQTPLCLSDLYQEQQSQHQGFWHQEQQRRHLKAIENKAVNLQLQLLSYSFECKTLINVLQKNIAYHIFGNHVFKTIILITFVFMSSLSNLFNCIYFILLICLLLPFCIKICQYNYGDGSSYTEILIKKLGEYRKLLIQASVNPHRHKYMQTLYNNLVNICKGVQVQRLKVETPTAIQIITWITASIKKIDWKHQLNCIDRRQKKVTNLIKIITHIYFEYRCKNVLLDLAIYQEVGKKMEAFEEQQDSGVGKTTNWTQVLFAQMEEGLQMCQKGNEEVGQAKIKVASNLIQLQQLCKLTRQHEQVDIKNNNNENLTNDELVQQQVRNTYDEDHRYIEIGMDGRMESIQKHKIQQRIQKLKQQLNSIFIQKSQQINNNKDQSTCQHKNHGPAQKQQKERRVEGLGGLFALVTNKNINQFYLE